MVNNYDSTSRSIISCLGMEIFVKTNRMLTKFCPEVMGSSNYDTVEARCDLLSQME